MTQAQGTLEKVDMDKEREQSARGLLGRFNAILEERRALRREIEQFVDQLGERQLQVEEGLINYRLALMDSKYKATKVDASIWDLYDYVVAESHALKQDAEKRPMFLHTNNFLRHLRRSWKAVAAKQDQLLEELLKSPHSVRFYDKMMVSQELHRSERIRAEENRRKFDAAHQSLQVALNHIDKTEEESGQVTYGSKILRLNDARGVWQKTIQEIRRMEKASDYEAEEIIKQINQLKALIFEAPDLAATISELEKRFYRLASAHEVLVSYKRGFIPHEELEDARAAMNELAGLWAAGKKHEIESRMSHLENFFSYYESTVQLKIALTDPSLANAYVSANGDGEPDGLGLLGMVEMARSIIAPLDARDPFMENHSARVAELVVDMGKRLGWNDVDLVYLEIAGLLHDVGKLSIPESILTKSGPLVAKELKLLRKHPAYGADIIKPIASLEHIVPWVYHHQERWDGKGYPNKLSKDEIPTAASIIGVAEAYSVMTTGLAGREALPEEEALEEIKEEANYQFNPEIVDVFLDLMADRQVYVDKSWQSNPA